MDIARIQRKGVGDLKSILANLHTEQPNPAYDNLDVSSTREILQMMNEAEKSVPEAVAKVLPDIERAVELTVRQLQSGGRLIYVGAGTSGRLGVLDASECPPTFNTPPTLVRALIAGGTQAVFESVEEAEDQPLAAAADLQGIGLTAKDVVVGIAASGRTPYVIGALEYANQVGAATIALSCNPNAVISSLATVAIEVDTGPEVLMGSTRLKAGTAQKQVLNMISTATMVRLGKVYRNLMVDLQCSNEKLLERSRRIIMLATGVSYDEAAKALEAAGGRVKTAILMIRKGIDRAAAEALLNEAGGFLRYALGEAVPPGAPQRG
jgi:N-acetylmuramic acid 6-phosphate etherase